MPQLGETVAEGTLTVWHKSEGDDVVTNELLFEIGTDKVEMEVPAPVSGKLEKIFVKAGETVEVGAVLGRINSGEVSNEDQSTEESEKSPPSSPNNLEKKEYKSNPTLSDHLSPAVRRLISEHKLDRSKIKGTGRDGRIIKEDVIKGIPSMGTPSEDGSRSDKREKLSMLRRKVAERLVSVKNETAMLTTFNEADMSSIFDLRKKYKEKFEKKHGVGLGFMSFFTKAVVRALNLFPDVNSMIDGDHKISYEYCDISVAVSGPKGLMVPVVRNAELLSFSEIESEIKRLAIRARDGEITVDDMTGGTFTISNGGVFGSMLSTPIINPPQSGILGMHNIIQRPVAVDGKVEIRPMMYLALSYDHRIIDGKESVGFLVAVKEALEDPAEHLMSNKIEKELGL